MPASGTNSGFVITNLLRFFVQVTFQDHTDVSRTYVENDQQKSPDYHDTSPASQALFYRDLKKEFCAVVASCRVEFESAGGSRGAWCWTWPYQERPERSRKSVYAVN